MAQEVIIRKAIAEDVPSIVELWKEFIDFHKERDRIFSRSATGHEAFADYVKEHISSESACILAAEVDGDLAGYCIAIIDKYPPVLEMTEYGHVQNVGVTKKYRRMGIGGRLVEEARKWFSEKGIRRIEARVAKTNPLSTGFWAKVGFSPYLETVFLEIQDGR